MAVKTRDEMKKYAMELCLPLMERTARRRLRHVKTLVNDSAGYNITFLEAFCRPLWGIGPILAEDGPYYLNIEGRKQEVCQWIRQVLLDGVTAESEFSWDRYRDCISPSHFANQVKTELAGLMLGIFLARKKLWEPFSEEERRRIADWVYGVNRQAYAQVWDCNHIWFVILNLTILKRLGFTYPETEDILSLGLDRLDKMYIGGGFYQDGKFGRFDYYNAWAMQTYPLLWIMAADETFPRYKERRELYKSRTEELLPYFAHLFDETGCHIPFGRSLAYRFAASCIFPIAVYSGCRISPGLARRVTLKNISFFQENAMLDQGVLPPGFLYEAPQAVENYTSDGGAYWCVKAFLALLLPEGHQFWSASDEELPAEIAPFFIDTDCPYIHMPVSGEPGNGVVLYNNTAHYFQDQMKTQFFLDMAGFYSKFAYHSRAGFGISTRDSVSYDGMISLATPDRSMESHRFGFEDLGVQGGFYRSRHIPFANDPSTKITTWLLPLPHGVHVRVHLVRLSRSYRVREGGFTVPMPDDYKEISIVEDSASVSSVRYRSVLRPYDTTAKTLGVQAVHPGMHLLEPAAFYPGYETEPLEPGKYLFVCACGFEGGRSAGGMPEVVIYDDTVSVMLEGRTYSLHVKPANKKSSPKAKKMKESG